MPRYSVRREGTFSAAHQLREYEGDCERLHGHNYRVMVTVMASRLDKLGMVLDFKVLDREMKKLFESVDHAFLNEQEAFRIVNPTAENLAGWFFEHLSARINDERLLVNRVEIWENERSVAIVEV